MLTKKYYEMIARDVRPALNDYCVGEPHRLGVSHLARKMAATFAADNPKRVSPDGRVSGFDRARFLKAAGVACEDGPSHRGVAS